MKLEDQLFLSRVDFRSLDSHLTPYVLPAFHEKTCPDLSEVLN